MANKTKDKSVSVNLKSKKSIISISLILAIFAAIEFFVIKPYRMKIDELNQVKNTSYNEIQKLSSDLEKLKESYNTIANDVKRPLLLTPVDGSSIIGYQVKFEWEHDTWNKNQEYILEIRKLDKSYIDNSNDNKFKKFKISDFDPEHKMMFFPISKVFSNPEGSFSGEYLWRIKPGNLVVHTKKKPENLQGETDLSKTKVSEEPQKKTIPEEPNYFEVLQGEASHFNSFKIYPSVKERIKKTKKLLVGTSPTLISGCFSVYEIDGTIDGFDIDLISWIAGKLESELKSESGTKVEVEILDVPFSELLHKLRNDEFDAVISSLTSTAERETEGLKFTNGYFKTHQILIKSKDREHTCCDDHDLRKEGIKVGARAGSTNLKAAQYLSRKYGFEICRYQSYPDIYKAIKDQAIDFGLVDDVLVADELGRENGDLDKSELDLESLLKKFYRDEYGRQPNEADVYAIAVKDNYLLNTINTILEKGCKGGIQKWAEKVVNDSEGKTDKLRKRFKDEIVENAGY